MEREWIQPASRRPAITITDANFPADQATYTITVNVTTPAQHQADLSVSIQPSASTVTVGQAITYTITATNNGPQDAQDVDLSAAFLGGRTVNGATLANGQSVPVTGSAPGLGGGQVVVLLQPLAAGQSFSINVTCVANNAGSNMLSFHVPIQASVLLGDLYGTDPVSTNNDIAINTLIYNM